MHTFALLYEYKDQSLVKEMYMIFYYLLNFQQPLAIQGGNKWC